MIDITLPIEKLPHVGAKSVPRLKKLGIRTVYDLLCHFPSRYEDFTNMVAIADANEGSVVGIRGMVSDIHTIQSWRRRRLTITTAIIEDDTGRMRAVWFNQPFIERALPLGAFVNLAGKVSHDQRGLYLSNPSYEKHSTAEGGLKHTGRLVPVYPETVGITSKYLRFLIKPVLDELENVPEPLPEEVIEKYDLPYLVDALRGVHFPEAEAEAERARERFAFEELLLFQLRALNDRKQLQSLPAPSIAFDKELIAEFVKQMPFPLTNDQRVAAYEILQDIEKPFPMNRLLNGDVGSGKTAVALIAAYEVATAGHQVAFMVPTEILAKQHFKTFATMIAQESGISIGLLTGSEARQWPTDEITEEKISKKLMQEKIAAGEIDIVIGTHAVIQKNILFKKLGLVIIDEQHRFGVGQRMQLLKQSQGTTKSKKKEILVPHLLSMTATPIPRTFALTIYGDLDVSLIKEKPKGRQKIVTRIVPKERQDQAHLFIDNEMQKGRQVFVICPRIEASKKDDDPQAELSLTKLLWAEVKAVTEHFEYLSKEIFPHRKVVMLHGKMKAVEKNQIMEDFRNRKFDMLVSTSVIEVGVDVPNASIMMVESAERFGLAQLHQFRGRVGRGEHQSYCFLLTSDGSVARRLQSLEKIDNGFDLAEIDMKIRGPGEMTGVKQSGIPDLAMAALTDLELIKKARQEAKALLEQDPKLTNYPLLRARLTAMEKIVHFE